MNGTWTLEVTDDAGIDTGVLTAWEIQFEFPPEQCPTVGQVSLDKASYQCTETVLPFSVRHSCAVSMYRTVCVAERTGSPPSAGGECCRSGYRDC